jgi:hypothetical protein
MRRERHWTCTGLQYCRTIYAQSIVLQRFQLQGLLNLHNILEASHIRICLVGSQVNRFLFFALLRHSLTGKKNMQEVNDPEYACRQPNKYNSNQRNVVFVYCNPNARADLWVQHKCLHGSLGKQNVFVGYNPLGSTVFDQLALAWHMSPAPRHFPYL